MYVLDVFRDFDLLFSHLINPYSVFFIEHAMQFGKV